MKNNKYWKRLGIVSLTESPQERVLRSAMAEAIKDGDTDRIVKLSQALQAGLNYERSEGWVDRTSMNHDVISAFYDEFGFPVSEPLWIRQLVGMECKVAVAAKQVEEERSIARLNLLLDCGQVVGLPFRVLPFVDMMSYWDGWVLLLNGVAFSMNWTNDDDPASADTVIVSVTGQKPMSRWRQVLEGHEVATEILDYDFRVDSSGKYSTYDDDSDPFADE